jgi:tetratricopeptide (TPR) repeat protein
MPSTIGRRLLRQQGNFKQALRDYDEAIRLNPADVSAYFNRGNIAFDQEDYARAIADYDEALRLNPDHTNARVNRDKARRLLEG